MGIARLGEFICNSYKHSTLTITNIRFGRNEAGCYVRLYLRKAKTAAAGEIQIIHLQAEPSILNPVAAVERLIFNKKQHNPATLLFGTTAGPLKKHNFTRVAKAVWGPATLDKWAGHSF